MRKKIRLRKIIAKRTNDPGEIVRLLVEAEKIDFPERIYNLANDVFSTIEENLPHHATKDTAAAYLLKLAFILNREGQLELAPPKPPKAPRSA